MSGGRPTRAVLLLSGGLDSATTLAIARQRGFDVHALTVHYGQLHAREIDAAREVARVLGAVQHQVAEVDLRFVGGSALTDPDIPVPIDRSAAEIGEAIPSTYVPARNTVLLSLGLAWAEVLEASQLFIGVNAVDYSGYPDCRPEFLDAFGRMAALATRAGVEGRPTEIQAPLLHLSKADIVRRAMDLGVDPGLTFSCYSPTAAGQACGACDACRLRARGFLEAGFKDAGAAPTETP
jgi:7-cyano-7-deazaguanine synthase